MAVDISRFEIVASRDAVRVRKESRGVEVLVGEARAFVYFRICVR